MILVAKPLGQQKWNLKIKDDTMQYARFSAPCKISLNSKANNMEAHILEGTIVGLVKIFGYLGE